MISKDKTYQTKNGLEVRIYATDGEGTYPVQGAVKDIHGWKAHSWTLAGRYSTHVDSAPLDLIMDSKDTEKTLRIYLENIMSEEVKHHVHAHLMALYAQDAMETDKPWERWQCDGSGVWCNIENHPLWHNTRNYRHKPKTIRIGEYDVPEPLRVTPVIGSEYYLANVSTKGIEYCKFYWKDGQSDFKWLSDGLIHSTKESAQTHIDALLSFTRSIE